MMRGLMALGFVATMTAGLPTGSAAQDRDFEWSGRLEPGQELVVRGISGNVVARLALEDDARVEAHKTGRPSDFDRVEIVVSETSDEIVFCVVYDGRRGDSACRSDGDERGDHEQRNIRAGVDFEVYVPEGVRFSGHTVSGDVDALGLRSDVDAATVSGNVSVATSGVATGRTVSGDVDVELGSLDWRSLDFETVSGDINVTVPDGVDAEIEFESLSGDFESDFDLRVSRQRGGFVGHRVEATIGDGSRRMTFTTVSGDARLRRAGAELR